jgi:hypothetical protein
MAGKPRASCFSRPTQESIPGSLSIFLLEFMHLNNTEPCTMLGIFTVVLVLVVCCDSCSIATLSERVERLERQQRPCRFSHITLAGEGLTDCS